VIKKILPIAVVAIFILCLMVFLPVIGVNRNGARRWIKLPHHATLQPAEFAKLAVILFLANYFSKEKKSDSVEKISQPVLGTGIFVLTVFLQKDFSTAVLILLLGGLLFFVAGARILKIITLVLLSIPVIVLFVFSEPYRIYRLIAFLKPDFDIHGINFQSHMASIAITAGGILGSGLGGMTQINRIPEVQSDYIFAGWAEAMGFSGVLIYLCILGFFAYRGISIALKCSDRFASLCAFGSTAAVTLQSLINCGVVAHALPQTGIPLPFFSAGGSSLVTVFTFCGLLLAISRIKPENAEYDI
jgi:cell division protein FtsW